MKRCSRSVLFPPLHETTEKIHGRLEIRRIWVSSELAGFVKFPHCAQVAIVERIRKIVTTGEVQRDVVCLITSLQADEASPERILALNRGHWGIENKSHWVRDMSFDEDRSQIRTRNGPWMMAALRNLAISLIRLLHPITSVAKALRDLAARPHLALAMIGA